MQSQWPPSQHGFGGRGGGARSKEEMGVFYADTGTRDFRFDHANEINIEVGGWGEGRRRVRAWIGLSFYSTYG